MSNLSHQCKQSAAAFRQLAKVLERCAQKVEAAQILAQQSEWAEKKGNYDAATLYLVKVGAELGRAEDGSGWVTTGPTAFMHQPPIQMVEYLLSVFHQQWEATAGALERKQNTTSGGWVKGVKPAPWSQR